MNINYKKHPVLKAYGVVLDNEFCSPTVTAHELKLTHEEYMLLIKEHNTSIDNPYKLFLVNKDDAIKLINTLKIIYRMKNNLSA